MTEIKVLGRCSAGADTETPCPRSAVYRDGEEGPRFCEPRLRVVLMSELASEVGAVLEEWIREAKSRADAATATRIRATLSMRTAGSGK